MLDSNQMFGKSSGDTPDFYACRRKQKSKNQLGFMELIKAKDLKVNVRNQCVKQNVA